jgi:hypothetical protein
MEKVKDTVLRYEMPQSQNAQGTMLRFPAYEKKRNL